MSEPTKHEKKSLGLSTKIIAASVGLLVVVIAINYAVFMTGYSRDAQDAMMEKAAAFTAVADEAKNYASSLITAGAMDTESLQAELDAHIEGGGSYEDTDFFKAIPVIQGWQTALEAAEREGLDFSIASFEARNPDNEPEPGSFRHQMLTELTATVKAGGETTIGRVNEQTNTLHFMRAITLDQTCMSCHGDPATYDTRDESGSYDGFDVLGFKMEGWEPGYMHGAYEVAMPLEDMDAQVAGFFTNGMLFTVPVVVGGVLAFIVMLRRLLGTPLRNLVEALVSLADGDLSSRLKSNRNDEIGTLSNSFNESVENLSVLLKEVNGATEQVAGASTQIAASAEEMATGLSSQEQQTTQVSSAVEQMASSITEVARKSADAAKDAKDAGSNAEQGGSVVAETVTEIQGISTEVEQSSHAITQLGQKGEQIGEIIGVINEIADQTNLLALNAAIEAARAGEHGRGFAVVADEVRKLAERTTTATEEVANSIKGIQADTQLAVQRIEASSGRVANGVRLAENAGDALTQIVQGSHSVVSMIESIAAAAEQQSAASEQIARSVERINSVTRESSQGASQAAAAAANLSQQAETLQQLVTRFKL